MTIQPQNNNLNYLIDPTFMNANRLFVLYFPRNNNSDSRYSFSNYYVPKVKINGFNVLIDDLPVKNEEAYEKIMDVSNDNDYTTGNLLDYTYFKKHYKLIAIDVSKQTKLKDPQQINFIGNFLKDTGATMFFIIEKSEETKHLLKMETQKIVILLNNSENEYSRFATEKWNIIDGESKGNYSHKNPIKFLTKSIESSLCDYSDAYISVTGNITATPNNAATQVIFKNCAPLKDCRTEISDTFVDYADFINITIPMYNLIEYSDNNSDTSGNLWQFKRDEVINNSDVTNDNNASSFKYKASLIGNTEKWIKK